MFPLRGERLLLSIDPFGNGYEKTSFLPRYRARRLRLAARIQQQMLDIPLTYAEPHARDSF